MANDTSLAAERRAVLEIERNVQVLCRLNGWDEAYGIMALLTAAAHVTSTYSGKPPQECASTLAEVLSGAVLSAEDMFQSQAPDIAPNTGPEKGVAP